MMPLCFEIPLPDLQVALINRQALITTSLKCRAQRWKQAGPAASNRWVLLRVRSKREMQQPSGGWAGAAVAGPMVVHVVPVQKIMLNYSISWKSPHPHPQGAAHLCAHPHSAATL